MPSFKQRDRAKRVEPVETKRVVGNERSTLIDRVLQALETPAAPQETAIQPAARETATQAAARIAEPEPAPTRANQIDRVLERLAHDRVESRLVELLDVRPRRRPARSRAGLDWLRLG